LGLDQTVGRFGGDDTIALHREPGVDKDVQPQTVLRESVQAVHHTLKLKFAGRVSCAVKEILPNLDGSIPYCH